MSTTNIVRQVCTQFTNGTSSDLYNVPNELGIGVYQAPLSFYEVIPLTPSATCVVNAQTPTANVPVTLNTSPTNATYITYNGEAAIKLDCPRAVYVTSSTSQTSDQIIQISGYDSYGQFMVKNFFLDDGESTANEFYGYSIIIQVIVLGDADTAFQGTISVGTNNFLALPYHALLRVEHVVNCVWAGAQLTPVLSDDSPSSTEVGIFTASNWRVSTPSLSSDDARGIIVLPTNPNGTSLFTFYYYAYGADSNLQALLANNQYTAYTMLGQDPNPDPGTPQPADTPPYSLVKLDLTGVQYGVTVATDYVLTGDTVVKWTPQMLEYFKEMNITVPTTV